MFRSFYENSCGRGTDIHTKGDIFSFVTFYLQNLKNNKIQQLDLLNIWNNNKSWNENISEYLKIDFLSFFHFHFISFFFCLWTWVWIRSRILLFISVSFNNYVSFLTFILHAFIWSYYGIFPLSIKRISKARFFQYNTSLIKF